MAEVDADHAREQARQVLEGDRYQPSDVPMPLRGALRWIGDRMGDVAEPVVDLVSTPAGLAVSLVVVTAGTVAVAVGVARRRTRQAEVGAEARRRRVQADPRALDAAAEAAEAEGDLAGAVRLRFRAGVLRLEQAGAVPTRSDATTGRLLGQVTVPAFAGLARTFDAVAYGGRPATPADVAAARQEWPAVVAGATAAEAGSPDASGPLASSSASSDGTAS